MLSSRSLGIPSQARTRVRSISGIDILQVYEVQKLLVWISADVLMILRSVHVDCNTDTWKYSERTREYISHGRAAIFMSRITKDMGTLLFLQHQPPK